MRLVEFPVTSGGVVLVQVEDAKHGVAPAGRVEDVIERSKETLEQALEKVKPAAEAIIDVMSGLSRKPDELTVEFGIQVTAEASAVLAKAGVDVHYTVTLTWKASS